MSQQKPVLLAILVSDLILRDEATKKLSLIGLFNRITAGSFPCRHPEMCVFVSLTDGHGTCPGQLRLVNRATENALAALEGKVAFPNPKAVVEMNFYFRGVVFAEPGEYSFDFYCSGELIGSRPFQVVAATELPQVTGDAPRRPPES